MRIVIITQDEPFYLAENLDYLVRILPSHSSIVGCVVNEVSPFGKKETFFQKAIKTYKIFGLRFFLYYAFGYVKVKLGRKKTVDHVLDNYGIDKIVLGKSINSSDSIKRIKEYQPDILISILGNQIFKKPVIELAPLGCLNLHTALLPKYRGLMPTFWVLKHQEEYTGVSVFYVDEGIDSGPIVVQKKIRIGDSTQQELIKVTKKLGMEAIAEAVELIENDKVKLIDNDPAQKSYYSFPKRDDVKAFRAAGKKFF